MCDLDLVVVCFSFGKTMLSAFSKFVINGVEDKRSRMRLQTYHKQTIECTTIQRNQQQTLKNKRFNQLLRSKIICTFGLAVKIIYIFLYLLTVFHVVFFLLLYNHVLSYNGLKANIVLVRNENTLQLVTLINSTAIHVALLCTLIIPKKYNSYKKKKQTACNYETGF